MSYFGLNPVNQNQQLDEAASNPAGFNSDVGFFDNAVGAALSGLYSGLVAKPDQLLWAGMDKIVSPIAQFVNENTSLNDTSVSYIAEQRKLAEQQVKRLTPDAATTGTAGQVLYGLFDMGGQAVVGTTLGGPVGGAAAVTSLQGFSEFERLTAQGVDFRTAKEAGLVQGITAGAGTLIPMSLGLRAGGALAEGVAAQLARTGESSVRRAAATAVRATPDIAYAAGTNIAFGMAQRGLTAKTLRDGGYSEMANQYDVLIDRQLLLMLFLGWRLVVSADLLTLAASLQAHQIFHQLILMLHWRRMPLIMLKLILLPAFRSTCFRVIRTFRLCEKPCLMLAGGDL